MFSLDKTFATGIGSFPYTDQKQAVDFVLASFKDDIIFWPQLPKKSFLEQMIVQFSEKLPGLVIDSENKKIYIDTQRENFSRELEDCFQNFLDQNLDYFSISEEFASGLYELSSALKKVSLKEGAILKGQIVGPVTLGMMLKTENNQPILYNLELKEALVKVLSMKARWQIEKLKTCFGKNQDKKIIISIDEPYLVSFGSSFFTLKKEDVIDILNEVIEAIHSQEAQAAIHCCANTDWSMIMDTKLDILSFDACGYLDNLLLYRNELDSFLDRGGILSFGIVPNNFEAEETNKKEELIAKIKDTAVKYRKINKMLITSSCGCGTLSVGLSETISRLCVDIAKNL